MIGTATIEEYMRVANPIPTLDVVDADELDFAVAAVHTRRAAVMQAPTKHPTRSTPTARQTELGWAGAPVAESEESTMVTHQKPDIESPTPTPPPRTRRGPLMAAAVAVVIILAGVGIAFAAGAFDSESDTAADRLAVATELVDTWGQGWDDRDPGLVVSVFTDDGVYIDGDLAIPMENMEFYMLSSGRPTNNDRVGDLAPSGDNTYTWVQEFDYSASRYGGDMEIELEGHLAKRIEWLGEGFEEIGPATGS